jgi:hypothetical protein
MLMPTPIMFSLFREFGSMEGLPNDLTTSAITILLQNHHHTISGINSQLQDDSTISDELHCPEMSKG